MLNLNQIYKETTESLSGEWKDIYSATKNQAWDKFENTGFPERRSEKWKYTNLKAFKAQSFETSVPEISEAPDFSELKGVNLVFNNGHFISENSSVTLPEGCFLSTFSDLTLESLKKYDLNFETLLKWMEPSNKAIHSFDYLNTALTHEGLLVVVDTGVELKSLIQFFSSNSVGVSSASKIIVYLRQGAKCSFAQIDESEAQSFKSKNVYFILEQDAELNSVSVQNESKSSYYFSHTWVKLAESAKVNQFYLSLGGLIAREEAIVNHIGEKTEAQVHGVYLAKEDQELSMYFDMNHEKPEGVSEQSFKGIAADSSNVIFNGSVFIAQHAQKVDSDQQNKSLIFGRKAEVNSKPELEVYADDVKATHGATIGQLNESELFYLRSRAISEDRAVSMLSKAFVASQLDHVESKELKALAGSYLNQEIETYFKGIKYD